MLDLLERSPGQEFARAYLEHSDAETLVSVRTLLDSASSADEWLSGGTPLPPPLGRRRRFVRDLLRPPVPTSSLLVPYIREVSTLDGDHSASATAEGAAKNEATFQFADEPPERAEKVTAWIPATTEIFEDAPMLAAYVDGRLGEALGVAEDWQLLNGDGTGANLRGFLTENGLSQTYTATSKRKTITAAIRQVEELGTQVDGIVIDPTSYWDIVDDVSSWWDDLDLPVVRSPEMPANRALVGNFGLGATLREYSSVTIRRSGSHLDYFVKNKIAVLAELQEALIIHRADYFCEATLA